MAGERLLVVDDEDNLRSMLCAALRHHGFVVDAAADGNEALRSLEANPPDLMVLDVMMPGLDGFDVVRRIRTDRNSTPVLILTARDATDDKVRGLKLGADDYLEKPFSLDELVARIEAVLRRSGVAVSRTVLELGDVRLDDDAHTVVKADDHVHLSPTEFKLLRYLLVNQGRVVSKAQILDNVWDEFDGDPAVVETYVGYLRRKVDTSDPKLIHTIRGTGYTMRVAP